MHRITQEIPRRARVFGYGPVTLYGAAFQKLHLTFALPRRAPTTPDSFLRSDYGSIATPLRRPLKQPLLRKERFAAPSARLIEAQNFKAHE